MSYIRKVSTIWLKGLQSASVTKEKTHLPLSVPWKMHPRASYIVRKSTSNASRINKSDMNRVILVAPRGLQKKVKNL